MNNRAYSFLQVKEMDDDKRTFSGVASTPTVDRVGDIIEPMGITFKNPLPLLWQHKHDQPIGTVKFDKPTKDGVTFTAQIPVVAEPGPLKDRVDTAWGEIKHGLVRATSIGFRPIEYSFMDNGGIRYSETEVYELSAVTIPAQADAMITTVKSIDAALRKAAGVPEPEFPLAPVGELDAEIINIPQPDEPAAIGNSRVVKLDAPVRDGTAPFVIREIKRTK